MEFTGHSSYIVDVSGQRGCAIHVKLSALGQYIGWGRQFIRNSTKKRFYHTIERNFALAHYSQSCFHDLLSDVSLEIFHAHRGSMMIYSAAASFDAARERFDKLKHHGVKTKFCTSNELIALEPALAPRAKTLVGGVYFHDDEHGNAHQFTKALGQYLAGHGVDMHMGVKVDGFLCEGQTVTGVMTNKGDLQADRIVVAAGQWSTELLKGLRINLSIRPVKGSSLTYHLPHWTDAPSIPVVDDDAHVAITPMAQSIRIVGTAEICGYDPVVKPERMALLRRAGIAIFPQFQDMTVSAKPELEWSGHRPMTPDCMPVIGECGYKNLFLNTGHGYLGWTTGTGTSRAVADIVAGREPELNMAHYGLSRF